MRACACTVQVDLASDPSMVTGPPPREQWAEGAEGGGGAAPDPAAVARANAQAKARIARADGTIALDAEPASAPFAPQLQRLLDNAVAGGLIEELWLDKMSMMLVAFTAVMLQHADEEAGG